MSDAFSFAIRMDRKRGGVIAFINWLGESGESCLAGTLTGFKDEDDLREAAQACVDALNARIGKWNR